MRERNETKDGERERERTRISKVARCINSSFWAGVASRVHQNHHCVYRASSPLITVTSTVVDINRTITAMRIRSLFFVFPCFALVLLCHERDTRLPFHETETEIWFARQQLIRVLNSWIFLKRSSPLHDTALRPSTDHFRTRAIIGGHSFRKLSLENIVLTATRIGNSCLTGN